MSTLLTGGRKKRVFFSCIEEDKERVNSLRLLAANPNYDLEFYDESVRVAIDSGDADYIKRKIREKIGRTSITVCLISENTHTSSWVDWETGRELEERQRDHRHGIERRGACGVAKAHQGEGPDIPRMGSRTAEPLDCRITDLAKVTLDRLEDQIAWYDSRSHYCQRMYKTMKLGEILAAAVVPLLAGLSAKPWVTGAAGVLVVILEGVQLNQYHDHWISYRSTAEALKHEKYLHAVKAGPHAAREAPDALLAERIESLISQEHAKWVTQQEQKKVERSA